MTRIDAHTLDQALRRGRHLRSQAFLGALSSSAGWLARLPRRLAKRLPALPRPAVPGPVVPDPVAPAPARMA
ncbi:MAG: hypothetical protein AAGI34_07920 [Pseudomonadota bacterium]